jgi:hypothetical protein
MGAALEIQHKRHSFAPAARRQSGRAVRRFRFGRETVYDSVRRNQTVCSTGLTELTGSDIN